MSDFITIFIKDIENIVDTLIKDTIIDKNFNKNKISIDFSSQSKQGDISTNLFIILSNFLLNKEFVLKEYLHDKISSLHYINKVDIAKIGFVNVFFKKEFLINKIKNLLAEGNNYGKSKIGKGKNINIEFVSANPTGPIHIGHVRGAVYGDVLAKILFSTGFNVTKEYYVNDTGTQINSLGDSLYKRYQEKRGLKINLNEGEYPGEYLISLAENIELKDKDKWIACEEKTRKQYFEKYAVQEILNTIKKDLQKINIIFDKFTFESKIIDNRLIDKVLKILKDKDLLYNGFLPKPKGDDLTEWESRKQLLFKSSNFFDDKDRAIKKSNGDWTYFANDAAYHFDKISRNFFKIINVWGADHIGYINRMKSIVEVISNNKNLIEIQVCQIVRVLKNGKVLKMSKRDGNFISLKKIVDEVGKDALRYYMVSCKNDTPIDFDFLKAIEKNKDNPVFYCQYAYARASSVINKALEIHEFKNFTRYVSNFDENSISQYEWEIILQIISWPYVLYQASTLRQPHKIVIFIESLCANFHSFWNKGKDNQSLRFIDKSNPKKTITKLLWINSMRVVLNNAFNIIGIDAFEKM